MIYCTLPWGFLHVLWAVCQMTPEFRDQRKRPLVGQHGKIQSIKWANICKLAVSWWFKWWYNMIFDIYIHVTCSHVLFDLHIYTYIYSWLACSITCSPRCCTRWNSLWWSDSLCHLVFCLHQILMVCMGVNDSFRWPPRDTDVQAAPVSFQYIERYTMNHHLVYEKCWPHLTTMFYCVLFDVLLHLSFCQWTFLLIHWSPCSKR